GLLFGPTGLFEGLLERTPTFSSFEAPPQHGTDWLSIAVGTLAGVLGLVLAWWMYAAPSPVPGMLAKRLGRAYPASYHKFYVDEIYEAVVVRPVRAVAVISRYLDEYLVHGLVRLTAWVPRMVGRDLLAPFQNGLIQFYAAVTAVGVAVLLLVML